MIDYQYKLAEFLDFTIHIHMPFYQTDMLPRIISSVIDRNAKEDIIFGRSSDNPTKKYFQTSKGTFNPQVLSPNLLNVSSVLVHDMDGDDHLDIVLANGSYRYKPDELNATIHIFFRTKNDIFSEEFTPPFSANPSFLHQETVLLARSQNRREDLNSRTKVICGNQKLMKRMKICSEPWNVLGYNHAGIQKIQN